MTIARTSVIAVSFSDRILAGALLLSFGLILLAGAGFAGSETVHNAAHDTRHALGFPCH
jgi:cobalt transporter subunit CbtB